MMPVGISENEPVTRRSAAELLLRGRKFEIYLPLGDGPAQITAGGANLEELARPQNDPLTDYQGNALYRVDVPILFDGWKHKTNVWPRVQQVIRLATGTNGNRPADFTAVGPIPLSGERFVMELPELGTALRSPGGALVRQALTLKLVQYVDPDVIRFRKRGQRAPGNGGTLAPATIVLSHPMTLIEVAAKYMGDASRAKEVGKKNGIRDVTKKLPAGTRLKLPGG